MYIYIIAYGILLIAAALPLDIGSLCYDDHESCLRSFQSPLKFARTFTQSHPARGKEGSPSLSDLLTIAEYLATKY